MGRCRAGLGACLRRQSWPCPEGGCLSVPAGGTASACVRGLHAGGGVPQDLRDGKGFAVGGEGIPHGRLALEKAQLCRVEPGAVVLLTPSTCREGQELPHCAGSAHTIRRRSWGDCTFVGAGSGQEVQSWCLGWTYEYPPEHMPWISVLDWSS